MNDENVCILHKLNHFYITTNQKVFQRTYPDAMVCQRCYIIPFQLGLKIKGTISQHNGVQKFATYASCNIIKFKFNQRARDNGTPPQRNCLYLDVSIFDFCLSFFYLHFILKLLKSLVSLQEKSTTPFAYGSNIFMFCFRFVHSKHEFI